MFTTRMLHSLEKDFSDIKGRDETLELEYNNKITNSYDKLARISTLIDNKTNKFVGEVYLELIKYHIENHIPPKKYNKW